MIIKKKKKRKHLEMSFVNCLNWYGKNSFCKRYRCSDKCFRTGNADIFGINSDLYKEGELLSRAYCNVMQKP